MNPHLVTEAFELELSKYTGAPYVIALDCCTSAIFLALYYVGIKGQTIKIPSRTYMSVPCSIIQAGGRVEFMPSDTETLTGAYQLAPTPIYDCALRFTHQMYVPGTLQCISFTGPNKTLKLGKGGALLTDDPRANSWFRRARFSGRRNISYHEDRFDMLGWNFWMLPEIAARGLHLMAQFYDADGMPKDNPDLTLPYPDLSQHPAYRHDLP